MALRVTNKVQLDSRLSVMKRRLKKQHDLMDEVEAWRHLDADTLEDEIWDNVGENAPRKTIIATHIAATTDTVVAFLASKAPRITTAPLDPRMLRDVDQANANERLHAMVWDTIDRDRNVSLLKEISEMAVHRGVIVLKAIWLSPEERGEQRETIPATYDGDGAILTEEYEEFVAPGDFPVLVQAIDPRDCFWTLGRDDRVMELAHEQKLGWDIVCDMFPDIYDHEDFKDQLANHQTVIDGGTVTVVDYWNETHNIITINDKIYKNAEHGYGEIPFVVELVKPRVIRERTGGQTKVGVPFCSLMVDSIRNLSWADSLSASHLAETSIATLVHSGIDPAYSPYWGLVEGETLPSYHFNVDVSSGGRILPLIGNERMDYLKPPPIVDVLEVFKARRTTDMALVSFPESILSGAQTADVSGYAYSQMKQAAMARTEDPKMAEDRAITRFVNLLNRLIARNWDYLPDDVMTLVTRDLRKGGEQMIEVGLQDFENAGPAKAEIQPEVPINREQEWGLIFQMVSLGLMSKLTAMDQIGLVQDPSNELGRIAFEMLQQVDQNALAAVGMKYMRDNEITPVQQRAPAPAGGPAPMPPDVGMTGGPVAPQQSVPPDPMSGGMGGAAPQGGGMPDMQAMMNDPRVMQMLMQMMGQG